LQRDKRKERKRHHGKKEKDKIRVEDASQGEGSNKEKDPSKKDESAKEREKMGKEKEKEIVVTSTETQVIPTSPTKATPATEPASTSASSSAPAKDPFKGHVTLFSQRPRLAYSSATNKPVCLCIIWVHLRASATLEAPLDQGKQRHQCLVRRPNEPQADKSLICNYCR